MTKEELEKKVLILERDLEILASLMNRLNDNMDDTVDKMIYLYEILRPTYYHRDQFGMN